MKKLFGDVNLTWTKIIIMAVVIGLYTGASLLIPITRDTSFSDLGATFEVWIFFGIFIIMNSKTPKESALKCFIFFLISQPIIYFVQDIIEGTNLFQTYYKTWFIWTFLCLPMGYIGHYLKKDKLWGLLILSPMILLLGFQYEYYLDKILFAFPRHLLTLLFCVITAIAYPLTIFNNKKIKIIGVIISAIILLGFTVIRLKDKPVYTPHILASGNTYEFDDKCSVTIADNTYGDLSIEYLEEVEGYMVKANFVKEGKTTFTLECPDYTKHFNLSIKQNTYDVSEIKE